MKQRPSLRRDAVMTKILLHLLQKTLTKARINGMILMLQLQNSLQFKSPQLGRPLTHEKLLLAPPSKILLPICRHDISKPLPLGGPPGQTLVSKNEYRYYGLKVKVTTILVQHTVFHTGGSSARNSTLQDTVPLLIAVQSDST
nr:hypothetical protein [Tanacetum cinerariifolium]